eukprot:jgi/Botrbrau1/9981/Bobra.0012s0072.1
MAVAVRIRRPLTRMLHICVSGIALDPQTDQRPYQGLRGVPPMPLPLDSGETGGTDPAPSAGPCTSAHGERPWEHIAAVVSPVAESLALTMKACAAKASRDGVPGRDGSQGQAPTHRAHDTGQLLEPALRAQLEVASMVLHACTEAACHLRQLVGGANPEEGFDAGASPIAALASLVGAGCALLAGAGPLLTWQAEQAPSLLLRRCKSAAGALLHFRAARDALYRLLPAAGTLEDSSSLMASVQAALHEALSNAQKAIPDIPLPPSLCRSAAEAASPSGLATTAGTTPLVNLECSTSRSQNKGKRQKSRNPYILAVLEEMRRGRPAPCKGFDDGEADDYSDLDDFIVCKPGRNYSHLIASEFRYTAGGPRSSG